MFRFFKKKKKEVCMSDIDKELIDNTLNFINKNEDLCSWDSKFHRESQSYSNIIEISNQDSKYKIELSKCVSIDETYKLTFKDEGNTVFSEIKLNEEYKSKFNETYNKILSKQVKEKRAKKKKEEESILNKFEKVIKC